LLNPSNAGISGLNVWFDAADSGTVTLSGSNVTQWNDKSGNGRNVSQATTANQGSYVTGLNGLKVVSLSAGKTYSGGTLTVNGLSNMIIFAVVNNSTGQTPTPPTDGLGYGFLTWIQTGAWGIVEMDALANGVGWRFGTGQANNQPFATFSPSVGSNYNLLMVSKAGTAETAYQNGALLRNYTAANAAIANTSNAFTIGSANATNNIGEILVYTSSLTTVQRQQVEGYLAWKWGLQGSLPSNHPYATAAPTVVGSSLVTYGTESIDSNYNLQIAATSNVRITAPTDWRYVTADISGTSLSLATSNTGVLYRLIDPSFNALTLPATQSAADKGIWWKLYNTSGSNLSVTLTNSIGLTSPQTLSNAVSYTLYWNGTSNYIIDNRGPTVAFIFDGGAPSNVYSNGPAFDCGGVV
jgi:hypothetical protein